MFANIAPVRNSKGRGFLQSRRKSSGKAISFPAFYPTENGKEEKLRTVFFVRKKLYRRRRRLLLWRNLPLMSPALLEEDFVGLPSLPAQ